MKESWFRGWLRLNPGRPHASPAAMSIPHYRGGAHPRRLNLQPASDFRFPLGLASRDDVIKGTQRDPRRGFRVSYLDSFDALGMIARLSPSVFEAERDMREQSREFHYHITRRIPRAVRDTWHHLFAIVFSDSLNSSDEFSDHRAPSLSLRNSLSVPRVMNTSVSVNLTVSLLCQIFNDADLRVRFD
jgi:hypothetical protein